MVALLLTLTPVHAQVMSLQQCIDSAMVNERRVCMAEIDMQIADERMVNCAARYYRSCVAWWTTSTTPTCRIS